VPLADVAERPWQLEPAGFPHGEPLLLSSTTQQPRQSRRLNREESLPNGPVYPTPKGRPPNTKRRKPNNVPPNSLAAEVVEEEESVVDDDMEEDAVVMNGEDVVMKDAINVKSEPEAVQIIPNDAPLQLGDSNTLVASWNDKAVLATGYVICEFAKSRREEGVVKLWTIHPRRENRVEEQNISLPLNSGDVTSICWHVCCFLMF
jgi:hypothetical protein